MPGSPPPTSNPSSRSTPLLWPAATGCSPRPPAAPAPTAPSSGRSWTSCAPATSWSCGSWTGSGGRCGTWWTPSPGWPTAGSGSAACRRRSTHHRAATVSFRALAEFERDLIRERTAAGLAAARARGRRGGRPSVLTAHKLQVAREMYRSGQYTVAAIATTLGSAGPRSTGTLAATAADHQLRRPPPTPAGHCTKAPRTAARLRLEGRVQKGSRPGRATFELLAVSPIAPITGQSRSFGPIGPGWPCRSPGRSSHRYHRPGRRCRPGCQAGGRPRR